MLIKLALGLLALIVIYGSFQLFPAVLGVSTNPTKSSYAIAIIGDSMVDTMGENLDYLDASLKRRYPQIEFKMYNYGFGSQNVEQGLARFKIPFSNKTRNFDSITQLRPDIIIIGSFGYNPFTPHDRDKHRRVLADLIQEAKNSGSSVYLLAEIAPLKTGFGKGPNGVNWPEELASIHSQKIVEQLENAVYLAQDHLQVPLINAYGKSLADGKFGQRRFVDAGDGIHPSVAGHKFMAELIAGMIRLP